MPPTEFFLVPAEIFRVGNATSPRLSHIRGGEVDVIEQNGVPVIIANGKGVSVYDAAGLKKVPLSGWVWRFKINTPLPFGLKLVNDYEHHYCIAPTVTMPVDKYKGLLEELALRCERVFKTSGVSP